MWSFVILNACDYNFSLYIPSANCVYFDWKEQETISELHDKLILSQNTVVAGFFSFLSSCTACDLSHG